MRSSKQFFFKLLWLCHIGFQVRNVPGPSPVQLPAVEEFVFRLPQDMDELCHNMPL